MENKSVAMVVEWKSGSITTYVYPSFKVAVEVLYSIRDMDVVISTKIMLVQE